MLYQLNSLLRLTVALVPENSTLVAPRHLAEPLATEPESTEASVVAFWAMFMKRVDGVVRT